MGACVPLQRACCPLELRLGQEPTKHSGTSIKNFHREPHRPARPLHIQGNRMQGSGGKNPQAVSAPLTEQVPNLRAESVRVPENRDDTNRRAGCPPTHTPPNEIGAGTHKTIPARAPRIFIKSRTARPVPCTSRAIMRRGPGVRTPGAGRRGTREPGKGWFAPSRE